MNQGKGTEPRIKTIALSDLTADTLERFEAQQQEVETLRAQGKSVYIGPDVETLTPEEHKRLEAWLQENPDAVVVPGVESRVKGVYAFEQLLEADVQARAYVIEGLIAQGQFGFLAGRFSIGKTFLALQMSLCLASGRNFLGRGVDRPYRVLFLDTENEADEMKPRLVTYASSMDFSEAERRILRRNWFYVDAQQQGPLQYLRLDPHSKISNGFDTLAEYIQREGIEIVFVDNFGKVYPHEEKREEPAKAFAEEMSRFMNRCPTLRKGSVVFLHHVVKLGREAPSLLTEPVAFMSMMRGTGRLLDFAKFRLALADDRNDGEPSFILGGFNRSTEVEPLVLERDSDSLLFAVHDNKEWVISRAFEGKPRQLELFNLMRQKLQTTFQHKDVESLQDSHGKTFPSNTISRALGTATANGLIRKLAGGSYEMDNPPRKVPTKDQTGGADSAANVE